jgi:YVTN family beta-propeller protein
VDDPGGASIAVASIKQGIHPIYITNEGSKSVSVIDPSTNTVAATVTVGSNPVDAALTPDGTAAYITNAGADSVSVLNTANPHGGRQAVGKCVIVNAVQAPIINAVSFCCCASV